jgi:antitoxin VapB
VKVLFLSQKSLLKTNTKFKRFVCKALNLKGMLTIQIPPAPPIKQKATARWPFALLWFRGGREAPFGVQPELAQQAQTTPKGRPLVAKREVSGKAANKSPQLPSHLKVAALKHIPKQVDTLSIYLFGYMLSLLTNGGKMMETGTVFKNNSTQAVRLPVEARFPETVKKVIVRVVGQDRILTPVSNSWDSFFMQTQKVTDDFMTERATQEQPEREAF